MKHYKIGNKWFYYTITERNWWVSEWNYASLNLGIKSWDETQNVLANREILANETWKDMNNFLYLNQVHWEDICIVKKWETFDLSYWYDSLITNDETHIAICLVADCVPVLVYDNSLSVFWSIHSWWKGAALNIVRKTIQAMQETFWSYLWNIQVIIGPCISQENYEVNYETACNFWEEFCKKNSTWWYQLDLRWVILHQCKKQWVKLENIVHHDNCTYDDKDYFSARREGYASGRFALCIYKKNPD